MKPIFIPSLLAASMLSGAVAAAPFDGPYVGAQAGYERFNVDDDFTGAGALAGTNASSDFHAAGANGGLFAGYGKRFDGFYLGADVDGSLGNAYYSDSTAGITSKVEHKHTYGASLRAGVMPTEDALIYARLGVVRSRFDYNIDATSLLAGAALSGDTSLTGLRLGLGAEKSLTENLTARLDWAYTNYEDYDINYIVGGSNVGTEKLSPSAHTLRVGLAYNF